MKFKYLGDITWPNFLENYHNAVKWAHFEQNLVVLNTYFDFPEKLPY